MAKITGQGFNKEKLIFLLASLALGAGGYFFITSKPPRLQFANPVSTKKSPGEVKVVTLVLKPTEEYLTPTADPKQTRKSPFTLQRWRGGPKKIPVPVKVPKIKKSEPDPALSPPPPQNKKDNGDPGSKGPMKPSEKDLAVTFMGVVRLGDDRYALLGRKDGEPPIRVKIGDTIDGLGYTITDIKKQSILLEDADKNPYILRDNRFSTSAGAEAAGGGGGKSSLPGGIPSFQQAPQIIEKIKKKLKSKRRPKSQKKSRDRIKQERRSRNKEGSNK